MKKFVLLLSVLGIVLFLTGACSLSGSDDDNGSSDSPSEVPEEEPNDSKTTADYFGTDDIGKGTIANSADDDYWKTGMVAGYDREVSISADSTVTVDVKYWDNAQLNDYNSYSGTSITKTFNPSSDLTYYFIISSSSSGVDYTITTQVAN